MSPWLIILYALGGFTILLLLLKWYLDRVWKQAGRAMQIRHRTAHRILETRKIPLSWVKRYLKPGKLDSPGAKKRAKQHALKRLAAEIRYFENVSPFETPDAKRMFMSGIKRVEKKWNDTPESEIETLIDRNDSNV